MGGAAKKIGNTTVGKIAAAASTGGISAIPDIGKATGIKMGDITEGFTGARAQEKARDKAKEAGRVQEEAQLAAGELQKQGALDALARIDPAFARAEQTTLAGLGGTAEQLGQGVTQARLQQEALLGLGGNSQAAFDQILNSPQFLAQQKLAERSLQRKASAFGNLVSGSTIAGLGELNQQLAGQAIQQQLANLSGFQQQQRQGLSGLSALQQNLGMQQADITLRGAQAGAEALTGAAAAKAGALNQQGQLAANQAAGIQSGLFQLGGAAIGGVLKCDRRLKENIEYVGKIGPHNIYSFNYKGQSNTVLGPMADEVEAINPEAVKEINGFKVIDVEAMQWH